MAPTGVTPNPCRTPSLTTAELCLQLVPTRSNDDISDAGQTARGQVYEYPLGSMTWG